MTCFVEFFHLSKPEENQTNKKEKKKGKDDKGKVKVEGAQNKAVAYTKAFAKTGSPISPPSKPKRLQEHVEQEAPKEKRNITKSMKEKVSQKREEVEIQQFSTVAEQETSSLDWIASEHNKVMEEMRRETSHSSDRRGQK